MEINNKHAQQQKRTMQMMANNRRTKLTKLNFRASGYLKWEMEVNLVHNTTKDQAIRIVCADIDYNNA